MSKPDSNDSVPNAAAELEQKLDAARKEKTLAQTPALRRLRMVVRVFVIFGALTQIAVLPIGLTLRQIHNAINQAGLGVSSSLAFMLYAVTMCISMAASWLLLCAYARFLRQFRKNHVRDIEDTTAMILPLFRYQLLFLVLAVLVFPIAIFQNVEAALASAGVGLGSLVAMIVMYFIVRRYVTTAQAELPALAAAAGDETPRGNYHAWKSLFLKFLVIALIVLVLGYVSGSKNTISWDQALVEASKNMNATLPIQVDLDTRLDTTMAGPGNRLTYLYTLINLLSKDLDQAKFIETMRQQLINNYKTNPELTAYRDNQVELLFHYRDKDGNTVAIIAVSPKDF